jgi:flagellar hook-associated protein 2
MAESINLNNLSVDSTSGRVSFSGLGSGIDYKAAVEGIMKARRIPVDRLEARVTENTEKITAYKDLKSLLSTLKDAMNKLRGAVTFGGAGDVFQAKSTFASTSRADGNTPSAAANLLGVTVTNAASLGSHTIEVTRIATAQKLGSRTFSSATTDLGTASGGAAGSISGSFSVNGTTITVGANDTLQDVRDRINNANTGATGTGVSASIVSVGTNQQVLVLTADKTGTPIALANDTNGVLNSLGISADGGTTYLNQLQAPQTAQFYADGLLDNSKWQSAAVASRSADVSTYAGVAAGTHSFEIRDGNGALLKTVSYSDTDDLDSLAAAITDAGAGITASVVADGSGFRLKVAKDDGSAITLTNDSNNLLSGLGMGKERLLIERPSNTVSDLFTGVTLSLYGAEAGTTVKLDVDRNLNGVKTAVTEFVDSFNAVRAFINLQNKLDDSTGEKADDAGPLFGARTLSDIESALSRIIGSGTRGVTKEYSALAQIGITFVDNNNLDDPLEADTLTINETKLDAILLSNPEDVRRLFAFDFSSSDPRVSLLSFTGSTTYKAGGYTLNLTHDGTNLTGADINGEASSATVDGKTIAVTDATGAEGLRLFYGGTGDVSGVQINFTVGLGAELFSAIEGVLDETTGSVQAEIDNYTDQNELSQTRIEEMLRRLDYQREVLTASYERMEVAISSMNRILDSIKQTFEAQNNND